MDFEKGNIVANNSAGGGEEREPKGLNTVSPVEGQQEAQGDINKKIVTCVDIDQSSFLLESEDAENVCMESDKSSIDTEEEQTSGLMLVDLPTEVLVCIAAYLDSRTIIQTLCNVCQLFHDLFSGDRYWRTRLSQRWSKPYPIIHRDNFDWSKACMEREEASKFWSKPEEHFNHFVCKDGFFAAVDIVHLMKGGQYLAIGSRDRHINLLDLTNVTERSFHPKDLNIFSDDKTHKGWVWSMASHDNTLVTGSWDTYIRMWELGNQTLTCTQTKRLKSAILCLHYEPGFIAAGGFDKRLYMFDPRDPDDVIRKHYHSQPLLSLVADDKYVITGSEDKVISIYDRVAGKNLKKIQTDSFIMDMSYGDGQLWTGSKNGKLQVLNTADGLFDESTLQTVDVGHTGGLTGVVHTDGALYTCSTDAHVKVSHPTLDADTICDLHSHTAAVARISYNNGVLASAGSDIAVGVWIPKYKSVVRELDTDQSLWDVGNQQASACFQIQ